MIALGWIIYAVVYAAFGFSDSLPVVIASFWSTACTSD